jgi:hypothetical protein
MADSGGVLFCDWASLRSASGTLSQQNSNPK